MAASNLPVSYNAQENNRNYVSRKKILKVHLFGAAQCALARG
jgi:hypothetical protein